MSNWLKIIIGLFLTIIVITIFAGFFFFGMLKKSLPDYNGQIESEKITSEISIYTDSIGIPYIIADNDNDVAFALGYLHSRERLFSMDLIRRAGEGRLSEIFGEKTLKFDELFRTIGITNTLKANFNKFDNQTLSLLKSYSDGVNAFIDQNKSKLPIEFDILGYIPEKWNEINSLTVIRMMGWELNFNWWADFVYAEIVEKFGKEKSLEILPDVSDKDLFYIPDFISNIAAVSENFIKTNLEYRKFFGIEGTQTGSNNWVVSGHSSVSGKPIIANDPHLPYTIPSRWYISVIKSNQWDAAGVTLSGVPGIVIGKNEHISWALTNLMNDEIDFYYEQLDSTKNYYLLDQKWVKISVKKDTIKIKNSKPKIIEILSTHRGPIISDVHQITFFYNQQQKYYPAISMRWLGNEFSDEMLAFYKINKSKNFQDFRNAVSDFAVPGQNFLYADKSGNITYIMGAKIPHRSNFSSPIISDGTKSSSDWIGYVPSKDLIVDFNPSNNFLATANNNNFNAFKFYISHLWEPQSRYERIIELLKKKQKHSVEDFHNYQVDKTSKYAEHIVPMIIEAFENVKVNDSNLKQAIQLFENWDFNIDEYSQTATIYQIFLNKLLKNIYYDEMGEDLYNKFLFVASVPYRSLLKTLNSNSDWLIDHQSGIIHNKNSIIRKSISDALTYLEKNYGKDMALWQWGRMHKVIFKHPFAGQFKPIDKIINIGPFEIGGDGTTILNTEYSFAKKIKFLSSYIDNQYDNILGPSMRFTYDFGNPNQINLVLTTGQSGNIFSKHYRDMTQLWLKGKYLKVNTDISSIFSANKQKLIIMKK